MEEKSFIDAEMAERRIDPSFADAMLNAGDKLYQKARQRVYYDNPHIWAAEVLKDDNNPDGFYAWSKQVEIGHSVVNNSYTAVKSCHGAGKSAWAAVLVCWFVDTRLKESGDPTDVFVITTAPSYSQVHLVLWEEIRKLHSRGNLPGYITGSDSWKIEHNGKITDIAVGRKPADTDSNSFQGKHAFNLFIVLDEANGIPETLFTGAVSMLTGDMSRQKMLIIGNPDDPNSLFGQEDKKDKKRAADEEEQYWNWVQIKAWDTPNFTEEKHRTPERVLKSVLQEDWVRRAEQQWAKDDARWISKIEAEFPDVSEDSFFPISLIEQSQKNQVDPGWKVEQRIMGVDVSRFGSDRTVVSLNDNGKITILDSWTKKSTIETTNRVHNLALEYQVFEVRIDEGNVGGAIIDNLRVMMGYNYRVIVMNSSNKSPNSKRWLNARAFWYDQLKEGMMLNRLQLPNDADLEKELSVMKYKMTKLGALQMEDKDEMKKRLKGRSPDFADSVAFVAADLTMLIEGYDGDEGGVKPHDGDEAIIDVGMDLLMRQLSGGFSVSPV